MAGKKLLSHAGTPQMVRLNDEDLRALRYIAAEWKACRSDVFRILINREYARLVALAGEEKKEAQDGG
jgi:hypothetical protein